MNAMGPRTLAGVLDKMASRGYTGEFSVGDDGDCRCLTCNTVTALDAVQVDARSRIEGASDPADNAVVLALRCPSCESRGSLVVRYGPEASAGEADLLTSLHGNLPEVDALGDA